MNFSGSSVVLGIFNITVIEGLGTEEQNHNRAQAFLEHDFNSNALYKFHFQVNLGGGGGGQAFNKKVPCHPQDQATLAKSHKMVHICNLKPHCSSILGRLNWKDGLKLDLIKQQGSIVESGKEGLIKAWGERANRKLISICPIWNCSKVLNCIYTHTFYGFCGVA